MEGDKEIKRKKRREIYKKRETPEIEGKDNKREKVIMTLDPSNEYLE
jgi:hypothetical protein